MTITAIGGQAGGVSTDSSASTSRAFGSNVTAGTLIVVVAGKDSGSAFVAGDCTKSAGTATIGAISLDTELRFDIGAGEFISIGIWSCLVTGAGSCTMQVAGAAGTFWGLATDEYSTDVGWDVSRVENTNSTGNATDDAASATSGNATSAGAALFMGGVDLNGSGAITLTPDGAFTQIFEQEDGSLHSMFSAIRRIVSTGTTDSADWAITAAHRGSAAALVAYKEIGGGSGGATGVGSPQRLRDQPMIRGPM